APGYCWTARPGPYGPSHHLLEPAYAFFRRRMSREKVHLRTFLFRRIGDVKSGTRLRRGLDGFGRFRYFPQRRRERPRIAAQFRTGRVRQIFSVPRNGELDEHTDEGCQQHEDEGYKLHNSLPLAVPVTSPP